MRRPVEFVDFPQSLSEMHQWGPYRAVVRQVIDADTFDVLLDLGFSCYVYQTIRLYGVDAPERHTAAGKVAQAWLRQQMPIGTCVLVTPFKDATTFGRYVATVTVVLDGRVVDVATALVNAGHAVRMDR